VSSLYQLVESLTRPRTNVCAADSKPRLISSRRAAQTAVVSTQSSRVRVRSSHRSYGKSQLLYGITRLRVNCINYLLHFLWSSLFAVVSCDKNISVWQKHLDFRSSPDALQMNFVLLMQM